MGAERQDERKSNIEQEGIQLDGVKLILSAAFLRTLSHFLFRNHLSRQQVGRNKTSAVT
jgi:hypothetical protein